MGLFRRRAKKNREMAAAEPVQEQSATPTATATATAPAEAPAREATAEARPNPDKPGWGESIGLQIGKTREGRASQE